MLVDKLETGAEYSFDHPIMAEAALNLPLAPSTSSSIRGSRGCFKIGIRAARASSRAATAFSDLSGMALWSIAFNSRQVSQQPE